ncbi:SufS family cysteine desulfurase [Thalassotalea ponticola]|uniref:SufS family cysteine desulfurase n=1 Tax=Thalassotalea ponticola TaxID=1523392 RepID=UPI0025B50138|nr:SufS family cysteine desulfurase [Thalassotalea ponticola]MDN3653125.1 SufS family cysteine desulfurase [Thalassotalea ponticola]
MSSFNPIEFRKKFPLIQSLANSEQYIYFDNAATTQKFSSVIQLTSDFYAQQNANVHRGSHRLSAQATSSFEQARDIVRRFINARCVEEVIWTKGTTEAINLVARSFAEREVRSGDEIVVSAAEHHANIVCWQQLAQEKGARLVVLPVNQRGEIEQHQAEQLITSKCRLLAIHHVSNVVGKITDVKPLIDLAHRQGAKVLIDGAQAVAHIAVDVQQLDCDFYVFSGHKLFAPTGIGVLYGKKELLEAMRPYQFGGEMIKHVSFEQTTFNQLPFKFEPGTPNIAGALGLAEAIEQLLQYPDIDGYERSLTDYLYRALTTISGFTPIFDDKPDIPLLSFNIAGHHHQDVAAYLDSHHIAVRAGHHCAMPLLASKGLSGSLRVSLAPYNQIDEIDRLVAVLQDFVSGELPSGEHVVKGATSDKAENNTSSPIETSTVSEQQILTEFKAVKGWDQKHRLIMLLSKQLNRLDKQQRNKQTLIEGCESQAWLTVTQVNGHLFFSGDSEARLIRGLMVIIFSLFQGKTAAQIAGVDVDGFFQRIGLMQHLSPSRGNGVRAIVARIQLIASAAIDQ